METTDRQILSDFTHLFEKVQGEIRNLLIDLQTRADKSEIYPGDHFGPALQAGAEFSSVLCDLGQHLLFDHFEETYGAEATASLIEEIEEKILAWREMFGTGSIRRGQTLDGLMGVAALMDEVRAVDLTPPEDEDGIYDPLDL